MRKERSDKLKLKIIVALLKILKDNKFIYYFIIIIYSYCIELKAMAMGIFRVKRITFTPFLSPRI
jgi:hypothetical protein